MAFWNQTLTLGPLALPLLFLLFLGTFVILSLLNHNLPQTHKKAFYGLISAGFVGGYLLSRLVFLVFSFESFLGSPALVLMNLGSPWGWILGFVLGGVYALFFSKEKVDWKPAAAALSLKTAGSLGLAAVVFFSLPLLFPEPESRSVPPLATLTGGQFDLSEAPEETYVLNFWASWCGPCAVEIPEIQEYLKENPGDRPRFLGVNATTTEGRPEDIQAFVDRFDLQFPILLDQEGAWQKSYRVQSLPTSILINGQGQILNRKVGILSEDVLASWMDYQVESSE